MNKKIVLFTPPIKKIIIMNGCGTISIVIKPRNLFVKCWKTKLMNTIEFCIDVHLRVSTKYNMLGRILLLIICTHHLASITYLFIVKE